MRRRACPPVRSSRPTFSTASTPYGGTRSAAWHRRSPTVVASRPRPSRATWRSTCAVATSFPRTVSTTCASDLSAGDERRSRGDKFVSSSHLDRQRGAIGRLVRNRSAYLDLVARQDGLE